MTDDARTGLTGARRVRVVAFTAALALLAVGGLLLPASAPVGRPGPVAALVALGALLVASSLLVVRFRTGRDVDSVTLVEAVLAPLLFAYAGPDVVLAVVVASLVTAVVRRTSPVKGAFNTAQWAFAVTVGSQVAGAVGADQGLSPRGLLAVVVGLLVVATVNNACFTTVLVLASERPAGQVLQGLAPVVLPGWVGGLAVNVALGLLYVAAFSASDLSVLLFPVPLVLLHLAYRGYALARSDRLHLSGLHAAAQALAAPVDPTTAVPAFLTAVATGFEAERAVLVLRTAAGLEVHSAHDGAVTRVPPGPLWQALLELPGASRLSAERRGLGALLGAEGHRSGVSAPLPASGTLSGCLVVLDQAGVEGLPSGETDVLVALAREAAATFSKGHLLATMLEDRRRLGEIVSSTSDGILTVEVGGTVQSWNPALERITGLLAADVVGRPGALAQLQVRLVDGTPVDLEQWAPEERAEQELRLTTPLGERRVLCSYDLARRDDGTPGVLVVVARDVTPAQDLERLRQDFSRLVEAEAARRLVVDHLQSAVMPARPAVPGAELGVTYVSSDPSSPTGGDLYDCQLLPSGELHLVVVDVLGHGVAATQDALAVMHALRNVVLDDTELVDVVARADVLLGRQDPDLVATVVVARYDPATGVVRLVSGGHPPALVVTAAGEVQQVEAEGGAIGWPGAGSDTEARVVLAPGDTLLLYTDGLVEARKDLVAGLEELEQHARQVRHLAASDLADALVARVLTGADRRDDTLALVLRRTLDVGGDAAMSWTSGASTADLAQVRREATAWLRDRGVDVGSTQDVALVLGELMANGVAHARSSVQVDLALTGAELSLTVRDDGPGVPAVPAQRADDDAECGRGLLIVRALVRDLRIGDGPGGVVHAVLDVARPSVPSLGAGTAA